MCLYYVRAVAHKPRILHTAVFKWPTPAKLHSQPLNERGSNSTTPGNCSNTRRQANVLQPIYRNGLNYKPLRVEWSIITQLQGTLQSHYRTPCFTGQRNDRVGFLINFNENFFFKFAVKYDQPSVLDTVG